jgi:hypothetical protein
MFSPKVALCRSGEAVTFRSSDQPIHNIHVLAIANREINQSVQQGGSITYTPQNPEFIRVKCDIHPWMICYLIVREHPYYALTNENGLAELKDILPGKYKVGIWHGTLKKGELEVEIVIGQKTEISVELIKPVD